MEDDKILLSRHVAGFYIDFNNVGDPTFPGASMSKSGASLFAYHGSNRVPPERKMEWPFKGDNCFELFL